MALSRRSRAGLLVLCVLACSAAAQTPAEVPAQTATPPPGAAPSTPENPAPAPPPPQQPLASAVPFFAHCGDLDQLYDPAPASPDRLSSYVGSWCASPTGSEPNDLDNQRGVIGNHCTLRITGYQPFDPDLVEHATIRIDIWYEPGLAESRNWGVDCIEFMNPEDCATFGHICFTVGLRETLVAAGQNRPQWVALLVDLINHRVDAFEIDARGNPVPGRFYPNLPNMRSYSVAPSPGYEAEYCDTILDIASKGSLEIIVRWTGIASFASLEGRAAPPASERFVHVANVEDLQGQVQGGSFMDLRKADGITWAIDPSTIDQNYEVSFVAIFPVGRELSPLTTPDAARIELTFRSPSAMPGSVEVAALDPAIKEFRTLGAVKLALGTRGRDELTLSFNTFPQFLDADGNIRLRFKYTNPISAKVRDDAPAIATIMTMLQPRVHLDRLRLALPTRAAPTAR